MILITLILGALVILVSTDSTEPDPVAIKARVRD